jgi:hypothetical protein
MKQHKAYRLSTTRRGVHFLRLMDEVFPPHLNHGVPWHHCINLDTMRVMDKETCPVAQILNIVGGDFKKACERSGIALKSNRELQHAGILLYNSSVRPDQGKYRESDKKAAGWTMNYDTMETTKLQAEIAARIAQRYERFPRKDVA